MVVVGGSKELKELLFGVGIDCEACVAGFAATQIFTIPLGSVLLSSKDISNPFVPEHVRYSERRRQMTKCRDEDADDGR